MAQSSKRLGKYELLEELGRGGFAVVYKARDVKLNRIVALKVLHAYRSADAGFVERFRREAIIAANLYHPNIVTVYEADEADGQLYLAMRYVNGRTLRDLLKAERALPLDRAWPILQAVAAALDYAHEQGVVHRDIKPANIMVEDTATGLRVTVLDFGLVKVLESSTEFTQAGTLLGSPEYMAPEQADPNRAREIGPATDRYALGVMAYQMLTGRVPFPGETPATLNAHLNLIPPDPQALNQRLGPKVVAALLKMLAKAPADRFATAREFVAALQTATMEQPGGLPQVGSPKRLLSVGVIIAVIVVLAIAVAALVPATPNPPTATPTLTRTPPPATATPKATSTLRPTPTATTQPSATPPPSPTSTIQPSATPTYAPTIEPTLGIGSLLTRTTDGMTMVYVPAGTFTMGSDTASDYEKPTHGVTLGSFWLDRTEVSNAQYAVCVSNGRCEPPSATKSSTRDSYYGNSQYDEFPVIFVSWNDADKYCRWAGGQLPTEAQWEYAARGSQGYIYPWGNTFDGTRLNFCDKNCLDGWADKTVDDGYADTAPLGNYLSGASWVGALNLAGNVWEWVADWYGSYSPFSQPNPTGPASGTSRVLRGGAWVTSEASVRTFSRSSSVPDNHYVSLGFRCVSTGLGQ